MKKSIMVGAMFGLCSNTMGAQYHQGQTELQPVYLQSQFDQQTTQINLDQFCEDEKPISNADRVIALEAELKEAKSGFTYYYRTSEISLLGFIFYATAIPAFFFKILSYAQAYSTCNTIKAKGGSCGFDNHFINPCDLQLSHSPVNNHLSVSICKMNAAADVCAYASVIAYIGITAYAFYRHCSGPQLTKHAMD